MSAEQPWMAPTAFGRGWVLNDSSAPTIYKRQQGGGGVLFWTGIIDDKLMGPFRALEGVKMNSEKYISFHTDHFVKLYFSIDPKARDNNAPSLASKKKAFVQANDFFGNELLDWPAPSPDRNPIEVYIQL